MEEDISKMNPVENRFIDDGEYWWAQNYGRWFSWTLLNTDLWNMNSIKIVEHRFMEYGMHEHC